MNGSREARRSLTCSMVTRRPSVARTAEQLTPRLKARLSHGGVCDPHCREGIRGVATDFDHRRADDVGLLDGIPGDPAGSSKCRHHGVAGGLVDLESSTDLGEREGSTGLGEHANDGHDAFGLGRRSGHHCRIASRATCRSRRCVRKRTVNRRSVAWVSSDGSPPRVSLFRERQGAFLRIAVYGGGLLIGLSQTT